MKTIHEIQFFKNDNTVRLLDKSGNIIWNRKDDKFIFDSDGLHSLTQVLTALGNKFESLWDIDERDIWVLRKK